MITSLTMKSARRRISSRSVVLDDTNMELREYSGVQDLKEGAYHILEPKGKIYPEEKYPEIELAVPSVLSVMRNVSVPFGITTPDKPHISSTRWRSVSDQKNKVYYFESTMIPNLFWLDLNKIDFSPNASIKKLSLTNGEIYAGDAVKDLKDSKGFVFLFQTPVM